MFMNDSFMSGPFMGLFVTTTLVEDNEEYLFSFIIDQSLPLAFTIDQLLPLTFTVDQQLTFNW